jgi:hypothetical protein
MSDQLIHEAIRLMLLDKKTKPHVFQAGEKHIIDLHQAIQQNWNSPSITFLNQYIIGTSANCFSAEGQGKSKRPQFVHAQTTSLIIRKTQDYLQLWNQTSAGTKASVSQIRNVGLWEAINNFHFPSRQRPLVLTMREICMMFPDQLTTIADLRDLSLAARLLDITSTQIHPLSLQGQVRIIIDNFLLKNQNLYQLSRFDKAAIAWWIPKAA